MSEQYEVVELYAPGPVVFRGYAIKKIGTNKLHDTNIWSEDEVVDLWNTVRRLNEETLLRQYWPDMNDPEVQTLVADPSWNELPKIETEKLNLEKSQLAYERKPLLDDNDFPVFDPTTGNLIYSTEIDENAIDWENSVLVYDKVMAYEPQAAQQRVFAAMEEIARRRAYAATNQTG